MLIVLIILISITIAVIAMAFTGLDVVFALSFLFEMVELATILMGVAIIRLFTKRKERSQFSDMEVN